MIDLHIHSTFSDGSLTPAELVAAAAQEKIVALALTDHDGTGGVGEFLEACKGKSVRGISGVEISADFNPGTMHILGYFIDPTHPALVDALARMCDGRDDRNRTIMERLHKLGLKIKWEDVLKHASEDVIGRPHIAQTLVEAGFVSSFRQAFDLYLGKGKPAYVERFRLTPVDGIKMIRDAGGIAVLGHPKTLGISDDALKELVGDLARIGLAGIEVYYSEHTQKQVQRYLALAAEFHLIVTGGSDFHGKIMPDVKLGRGFGSLRVPDELLEPLFAAAGRRM